MPWTNGKLKPIVEPKAFLRRMTSHLLEHLLKHKLILISKNRSSRRWNHNLVEKTFVHGKLRSTLLQWCLPNGLIGRIPLTSSYSTNSPIGTRKRSTFWFATTNGLTSSNNWREERFIPLVPELLLLSNWRKYDTHFHHQRSVHPAEYRHSPSHEKILAIGTQTIHLSWNCQEPSRTALQSRTRRSGRGVHSFPLFRHYARTWEEMDGSKSPCYYNGLLSLDDRFKVILPLQWALRTRCFPTRQTDDTTTEKSGGSPFW